MNPSAARLPFDPTSPIPPDFKSAKISSFRQEILTPKLFIVLVSFLNGLFQIRTVGEFLYEKDVIGLSPNAIQILLGISTAPISLKPIFGFIHDQIVKSTKQTRYTLAVFAVLRALNSLLIYAGNLGWFTFAICLLLNGVCHIFEVITCESSLIRESRDKQKQGSQDADQLSIYYQFRSIGAIIGIFFGGRVINWFGLHAVFLVFAGLALILAGLCLFYDEMPINNYVSGADIAAGGAPQSPGLLPFIRELAKDPHVLGVVGFIFLVHFTPTYDSLVMYYVNNELGFTASDLADMSSFALIMNIVGMFVYSKFLSNFSAKSVFLGGNVLLWGVFILFDLMIGGLGQSSFIFKKIVCAIYFGVASAVAEVTFMPVLNICCQVTPPGYEGTTVSLFSGLNAISYNIGTYIGVILTAILGVKQGNLSGFMTLLIIQNVVFAVTLVTAGLFGFPQKKTKTD